MSEYRRVVVTGIGAVTPLGNNAAETWEGMKKGKNGIGPITLFDTENFRAKLAAEVRNFDPREYLEVNEVLRTDRYAQFAVAAAKQAAEDSGVESTVEPERFAVIFGTGIGGISTFEKEHSTLLEKGPRRVSPLMVPMMIGNMAAGMIAIRHDCRGSVMPAVTACASGSNAIGEAMRLIRHGYADAAISGGAEAAIIPSAIAGLILEEYEHAKARGAVIYGEVCGYGSTCDAYHITAPHPDARGGARAMTDAMKEAEYTPEDVVYINAHGTGTPMNDVLETLAIKKALGEENAQKAYVSSTKSMTGHMLGAAGAVEALACLCALKEGVIPPTINLKEQDEACDLNCVPEQAVRAGVTLALSNSLGFGGHNACLAFRKV